MWNRYHVHLYTHKCPFLEWRPYELWMWLSSHLATCQLTCNPAINPVMTLTTWCCLLMFSFAITATHANSSWTFPTTSTSMIKQRGQMTPQDVGMKLRSNITPKTFALSESLHDSMTHIGPKSISCEACNLRIFSVTLPDRKKSALCNPSWKNALHGAQTALKSQDNLWMQNSYASLKFGKEWTVVVLSHAWTNRVCNSFCNLAWTLTQRS